ncbi:hypothetical protein LIER_10366 [Lithospermum erythrorhizon]|uniref:Uncharacterized protein n=1 Tax=Lithospermum erythrorhizon TaxID=34254 RepID=A0AAV3PJ57_LITER
MIPPQENRPEGALVNKPPTLLISWEDNTTLEEPNLGHGDEIQPEHSVVGGKEGMQVPPIVTDTGVEKHVDRTVDDVVACVQHPGVENDGGEKVDVHEKISGNIEVC